MAKESGDSKEYKTGKGASLYILIICTLLYMVNYMDRQVVAAVVEPMKAALNLNDGDIGVLGTVFLLSIALFSFPVAYLVDRWSRRKTIGIMAIVWSAFTFLTGKASSFWTLLIPRSLVGVGEAGFSSGGTAMVGAAYSTKKRGAMMGIFNMSIPLGVALGSVLGGTLAKTQGWQAPFLYFAIPGVILGILAWSIFFPTLKKTTTMLIGSAGLIVSCLLIFGINHQPSLNAPWVLPLSILLVISIMVQSGFTPAALAHLADITESHDADRGAIMGLYSVFLGLGQFLGASIGGLFVDWRGADGMALITGLLGVFAAWLVIRSRISDSAAALASRV